jgi:uncharacterized membrane protein
MGESFTVWLHLLAVSIWIGPQIFMFAAALPAIRLIEDREVRVRVMRFVVYRFGYLAWGAMLVIVLTGISQLFQRTDDFGHVFDSDYRYFHIFTTKMALLGLTVLLTAGHTFIVGPRQLRLAEEADPDPAEAARLRRASMIISSLALLASLAVLFAGALLANHDYSFRPT